MNDYADMLRNRSTEENEVFNKMVPSSMNPMFRSFMRCVFNKTIKYMDEKFSGLAANQCLHPESITAEEGRDSVFCTKNEDIKKLKLALEDFILENDHLAGCEYKIWGYPDMYCKCMDRNYYNRKACIDRATELLKSMGE